MGTELISSLQEHQNAEFFSAVDRQVYTSGQGVPYFYEKQNINNTVHKVNNEFPPPVLKYQHNSAQYFIIIHFNNAFPYKKKKWLHNYMISYQIFCMYFSFSSAL